MGSSRSLLEEGSDCSDCVVRDDFLSGTLGFLLPLDGDSGPGKKAAEAEGNDEVGVSDWLEYPLDGLVRPASFSGDVSLKSPSDDGREGVVALEPGCDV
ncbi:hypothetical protein VZT92_021651 [Zoarces viviparus]|uniref:Uncharacterized protein n=1 Tax=Zoarces viviparus TaxID=48416 RepID=A0AAW1E9L0_ZOAVI